MSIIEGKQSDYRFSQEGEFLNIISNLDDSNAYGTDGDVLALRALKGWSFLGTIENSSDFTGKKQFGDVVSDGDLPLYGNSNGSTEADFSIKLIGVSSLGAEDFSLS